MLQLPSLLRAAVLCLVVWSLPKLVLAQAAFTPLCGSDALHLQKMQQSPDYAERFNSSNQTIAARLNSAEQGQSLAKSGSGGDITVYTIPVAVHLIHSPSDALGQGANLTDAQVQTAVGYMNEAYRNLDYFDPSSGVDIEIEFCLASKSPSGGSTNGITRHSSIDFTYIDMSSDEDYNMKASTGWNPNNYMNIWVVNEICNSEVGTCNIGGYTYLASLHGDPIDGVVCETSYFGTSRDDTKVLIHEVGHYFNLLHTFHAGCMNTNCRLQGDLVCDTPPDATTLFSDCADPFNSCNTDDDDLSEYNPFKPISSGGAGDQTDMIENYMDYGYRICQSAFTQGQKDRMRESLLLMRSSLLDSDGCSTVFGYDAGISEVVTPYRFVCDGAFQPVVTLTNYGTAPLTSIQIYYQLDQNGVSVPYNWNGYLQSGQSENVLLPDFVNVLNGKHAFAAFASNPNGSIDQNPENDQTQATFSYTGLQSVPFFEDFESVSIDDKWVIDNPDGSVTWNTRFGSGCSTNNGIRSLYVNNFSYTNGIGQDDYIYTRLDLSGTNAALNFDVAYIPYSMSFSDQLKVVISTDCGDSFTEIYNKAGDQLATVGGYNNLSWQPNSCFDWRTETINLYEYAGQEVIVGFVAGSRYGNNLYVDNISVVGSNFVPCTPTASINASNITENDATISWANASDALTYNLRYKPNFSSLWVYADHANSPYGLSALFPGTTYEVQVQTLCSTGNSSVYSASAFFTTDESVCNPPFNVFTTNINISTAGISWNGDADASNYVVRYRDAADLGGDWSYESTSATALTLVGLAEETTYEVQIQKICSSGQNSVQSPVLMFTTLSTCSAPLGLVVTNTTSNGATVGWNPNSDALSYTLQHRIIGTSLWETTPIGSGSAYYSLAGLQSNVVYQCRIKSHCNGTDSGWSPEILFSTVSYCSPPSFLNLLSVTTESASVSWNTPTNAMSYQVRIKPKDMVNWTNVYNASDNDFVFTGLEAATIYEYQVKTNCDIEDSNFSHSGIFSTASTCTTPVNVSIQVLGETSIQASWEGVGAGAIGYRVAYRKIWPEMSNYSYKSPGTEQTTISSLDPGSIYEIKVQSLCLTLFVDDFSLFSDVTTFTTPGGCSIAGNLHTSNNTSSSTQLHWNSVPEATSYNVRYKKLTDNQWTSITTSNISQTLTGLDYNTAYEYQVQTVCGMIITAYSNSAYFLTDEIACSPATGLTTSNVTGSSAICMWDAEPGATLYNFRYRRQGTAFWVFSPTENPQQMLSGLDACTDYEFQVQVICSGYEEGYSESTNFTTGDCTTVVTEYCYSAADNSTYEWIKSIVFAGSLNISGNNGGYADYTNKIFNVEQGETYSIAFATGYKTKALKENWRVWIDFNQNFEFELNELVFSRRYSHIWYHYCHKTFCTGRSKHTGKCPAWRNPYESGYASCAIYRTFAPITIMAKRKIIPLILCPQLPQKSLLAPMWKICNYNCIPIRLRTCFISILAVPAIPPFR